MDVDVQLLVASQSPGTVLTSSDLLELHQMAIGGTAQPMPELGAGGQRVDVTAVIHGPDVVL